MNDGYICQILQILSSSKEVKHRGHQCDHTHGHTHVHSSIPTKNPGGDGPPPFRSSLRRTSGNLRDCEKVSSKFFLLLFRCFCIDYACHLVFSQRLECEFIPCDN
jgi:hypothetical protein